MKLKEQKLYHLVLILVTPIKVRKTLSLTVCSMVCKMAASIIQEDRRCSALRELLNQRIQMRNSEGKYV